MADRLFIRIAVSWRSAKCTATWKDFCVIQREGVEQSFNFGKQHRLSNYLFIYRHQLVKSFISFVFERMSSRIISSDPFCSEFSIFLGQRLQQMIETTSQLDKSLRSEFDFNSPCWFKYTSSAFRISKHFHIVWVNPWIHHNPSAASKLRFGRNINKAWLFEIDKAINYETSEFQNLHIGDNRMLLR